MHYLPAPRALLTVAVVAAAAALLAEGPALEPYLVLSRHAELYDGANRVPVRLLPGDVLAARPDDLHRGWLRLTLDRKSLQANGEHFGRLRDLEAAHARRIAELDSRIAEKTRRIAQQDEAIERLYAADHAARFDATVQYRYRQAVPPDVPPAASPFAGGPYVDTYEDKVPLARARSLAQRWSRERQELEKDNERLRGERREHIQDRLSADAQRAYVAWRFAAFAADAGMLSGEPRVTVKDRTELYVEARLAHELDADVVVIVAPNRDDQQWLKVRWNGQILDGRRSSFLSRLDVEEQFGRRAAWLEQALSDLQDKAASLAGRRQLLDAIGLAADYASQLDYTTLHAYPFASDYRGGRYYLPPACPGGAVEVVNRSRARTFVRACDREIDDLDGQLQHADRTLRAWRRELATIRPRLDDLRRRLDAVR